MGILALDEGDLVKRGDLIRNRRVKRSDFALSFTVFPRSEEDWMGIVLSLDEPNENTRYTTVRVLLSDGRVESSWLLDGEIREYVEVVE